jgi:hypothetical protein
MLYIVVPINVVGDVDLDIRRRARDVLVDVTKTDIIMTMSLKVYLQHHSSAGPGHGALYMPSSSSFIIVDKLKTIVNDLVTNI